MRAEAVLTVTMTETVHHELTLTAERLTEITGIPPAQLEAFIADRPDWTGLAGPHGEAVESLLDVIDCDTHYAGAEDRTWTIRQPLPASTPQPPPATAPAPAAAAVPDPRARTIAEVIAAYDGNTYWLLTDLADQLQLSLAYIDRETVEAHLERALADAEWAAANDQFSALDFDEHVGDHGSFRTDWIETVLDKAGVPGYGYTADGNRAGEAPDRGGAAA
jgi:hypothetical protein